MPNFSVVSICKNEAKTLPRLVASLKEFLSQGGEFILLDTGSTDGTQDIARKLGCLVVEHAGFSKVVSEEEADKINELFVCKGDETIVAKGDKYFNFAAARNFAASLAKNDMIAMPDCDESYTTLNLKVLDGMIPETEQFHYNFVFAHREDGSREIQFRHSKFYNRNILKWTGIVHEVLKEIDDKKNAASATLPETDILLEHFQNKETHRGQYLIGLALDLLSNPDNDRNTHYLAREFYYTRRYRSAIPLFHKHINMNGWFPEQARSQLLIGDCFEFLGDAKKALIGWHKAFDMFSSREPLIRIADHYFKINRHEKAAAYANASLTIDKPEAYFIDNRTYEARPHELLYWAYYYMEKKDCAREHFDRCIAYEPKNEKFLTERKFFYSN